MFRYYLLRGDTVAPSGLYARLCHAYLGFTQSVISIYVHFGSLANASFNSDKNIAESITKPSKPTQPTTPGRRKMSTGKRRRAFAAGK